jgi:hypothetical protein
LLFAADAGPLTDKAAVLWDTLFIVVHSWDILPSTELNPTHTGAEYMT